jgi:DNA-binding transcriptional LysR family regulator
VSQNRPREHSPKEGFSEAPRLEIWIADQHIDAIKSSLAEGFGISFISKRAIDRELQSGMLAMVPVDGVDLRRPICMLTNAHKFGSKIAIRLAKHSALFLKRCRHNNSLS